LQINEYCNVLRMGCNACWAHATLISTACLKCRDQLFGLLARAFRDDDWLLDPDDVVRIITRFMTRTEVRHSIMRAAVHVQRLFHIRDWRSWTAPLNTKMEGGLLRDEVAHHVFLFMLRRGGVGVVRWWQ